MSEHAPENFVSLSRSALAGENGKFALPSDRTRWQTDGKYEIPHPEEYSLACVMSVNEKRKKTSMLWTPNLTWNIFRTETLWNKSSFFDKWKYLIKNKRKNLSLCEWAKTYNIKCISFHVQAALLFYFILLAEGKCHYFYRHVYHTHGCVYEIRELFRVRSTLYKKPECKCQWN